MTTAAQATEREGRGRPRNPDADTAICAMALRLLAEQGYSAMSVESVAAAAGVSKATLYRRFKDKRELVVATLSAIAQEASLLPDTGSIREDLLLSAKENLARFQNRSSGFSMLGLFGTMLVQAARNPEFLELFREHVVHPRRQAMKALLQRGIDRAELRPGSDLDVAAEFIIGSMLARHVNGLPMDESWVESVVNTLLSGIAAGGSEKKEGTRNG